MNSDLSDIASALTASIAADGQTSISQPLKFPSGTSANPSHTFSTDLTTGMYYPGSKQLGFGIGGVVGVNYNMNNAGSGQNGAIVSQINGAVLAPVGILQDFAGSTAPSGWFLCYGQAVSRANYPELFTVIGTTYGVGDGSTTFNLPDCRGRVGVGRDDMGGSAASRVTVGGSGITGTALGATGGAQNVTIAQANLPNVNFTVSGITANAHSHTVTLQAVTLGGGGTGSNQSGAQIAGSSTTSNATVTFSSQGSAASGGSGTAVNDMQPTIIFNKIIFAGRV